MNSAERAAQADALLETLEPSPGGRLKIILGAAPGVGKTYAMLGAAHDLRRQGVDVVVGLVEAHGREETQALLQGLEVVPRRRIDYKGRTLEELDLDALLARRPKVALVDELAHRNHPGSRHERRFQDIQELLDAGIDVITTVNIQHLESLNDQVLQLTGVRVRETVPDSVFDRARDLVLVDLPPHELIDRLARGKVYVPEQARSALQAFFTPSNLTALRELAVQQVADRVDAELRGHMTARGLDAVPIRRRVLVAIDGLGNSDFLVRAARKLAERRQAPWTIAYVDTGHGADQRAPGLEAAFALGRRLGADTVVLRGTAVADELVAYARQHAVSTIVIGRTRERPIARMFNRTLTQQLLQKGAHFELTILNTPYLRARARRRLLASAAGRETWHLPEYAFAAAVTAMAAAVAGLVERIVGAANLSLVFLIAVLVVAARTRAAVAVFAALLGFLAYNFLFTEPRLTFFIYARHDVLTVALFLVAALIGGRLASRLRGQVLSLRTASAHTTALQTLGRRLATAADESAVQRVAAGAMNEYLDAEVVVLMATAGTGPLTRAAAEPASAALDAVAQGAADWCASHGQPAGRYTATLQSSAWWFLPLVAGERALGVVGLRPRAHAGALLPEIEALAQAMVQDLAQALGRVKLVAALEATRVQAETDHLRAALLASVSHDLRSPLAAIIGSAESLATYSDRLSGADRQLLAEAILGEGQRLDRYIQNLLDMTRLGHGPLKLHRDWVGLDEIVGAVLVRLRTAFPDTIVERALAPDLPLLYVHAALIEQALFNILENAARFSPPLEPVRLAAGVVDGRLRIDIADRGPGIPEDERTRIFDMFYSSARGDRAGQGTGLGLSICQGMIGAHGGSVEALPGIDGVGTVVRVTLPLDASAAPSAAEP
jgi:two-component system sensor histidine kinase KdpD